MKSIKSQPTVHDAKKQKLFATDKQRPHILFRTSQTLAIKNINKLLPERSRIAYLLVHINKYILFY